MISSLSLFVCALVCEVFWRVYIYISCERVGLSSRSRFPALVFCCIVLYIFVAMCLFVFFF